jgi:hypothetical protein
MNIRQIFLKQCVKYWLDTAHHRRELFDYDGMRDAVATARYARRKLLTFNKRAPQ